MANDAGFASGQSCTAGNYQSLFTPASAYSSFVSIQSIMGGPNDGLAYIASTNVQMQMILQVNRKYRSDEANKGSIAGVPALVSACQQSGAGVGAKNMYEVNQQCVPSPAYSSFYAAIMPHEVKHGIAAVQAAGLPSGDLHRMLGEIVGPPGFVLQQASAKYESAQNAIFNASKAVHNGMVLTYYHNIWDLSFAPSPIWTLQSKGTYN